MDLVTGGLGFIGNELVRQLRRHGPVAILDNRNRVAPFLEEIADVPVYEVDVTDERAVGQVLAQVRPDRVFHLAAIHYIPECNANPERTRQINVGGTAVVLRACAASGVQRVIVASTGAIYADSAAPLTESAAVAPVDVYGRSKAAAEELCQTAAARDGLTIVVARLFNNYGPRETNPHIIPEIISQLRGRDTLELGVISTIRDYIHTRETAEALRRLARCHVAAFETVNVGTGRGVSVRQLVDLCAEHLRRTLTIAFDPERVRPVDKQVQVADIAKLARLTGWAPQLPLAEGLRDLLTFEGLLAPADVGATRLGAGRAG